MTENTQLTDKMYTMTMRDMLDVCISRMLFNDNELLGIFCKSHNEAQRLLEQFKSSYNSLPSFLRLQIVSQRSNDVRLENGSTIRFMHDTLHSKGLTFSYIGVTEPALNSWSDDDFSMILPQLMFTHTFTKAIT